MLRKKISELPLASALAGTEEFELVQSATSKRGLISQLLTYLGLSAKEDIEWGAGVGTDIKFDKRRVYGSIASPEITDVTLDPADAVLGVEALLIHNRAIAPTFGAEFKETKRSRGYVLSVNNFIWFKYINSTYILYEITQQGAGYIPFNSADVDTDTALTADSDAKVPSQRAIKAYVDALIAASDAVVYKGATDCSTNPNYPAADAGHLYFVSVAGKIGGVSGLTVEAGDMFICKTDATASGDQLAVGTEWNVIQTNMDPALFATLIGTETLTNKRITPRVGTVASSATPTINTDSVDCFSITALAADITSMTTNLSGTPTNFQPLIIRIKDDGTARAITWGASFEAKGTALPTTTVISKVLTVAFLYDTVTSKWGCVGSQQEA